MGVTLETAKFWQSLGIATIPVGYKSKKPKVAWSSYTERIPDDNEINSWFASDLTNIAVITGWKNLCVIDFDDIDVFWNWITWAIKSGGTYKDIAMNARMHRSARGMHVFVLCENAENLKLPKIDVLAERKYALLPPSMHPSGVMYEVYRDALPYPVQTLYDVLPKRLLDDALAHKAQLNTTAPLSSTLSGQSESFDIDYDPWVCAGTDADEKNMGLVKAIKNQIPITSILSGWENSGGAGRWMVTKCPFHDDKNPSFWLDTKNNLCGCHAGCTPLPLDVIDLYARLNGIDNVQAIKELAQRLV